MAAKTILLDPRPLGAAQAAAGAVGQGQATGQSTARPAAAANRVVDFQIEYRGNTMTTKYLALSLAVALAALAGCGRSEPPKPAAKKSAAETFSSPAQPAAEPVMPTAPPEARPVSPDQIPNVGTAPPGQVAFGPSVPSSGLDPAGDLEREQMNRDRDKDNALKEQQAKAREEAQANAKAVAAGGSKKGNP